MSETMDAASHPPASSQSLTVATSDSALQKESKYFMLKGRGIRCIVALFNNIEDLIAENNRSQDCLQSSYIALNHALPWFHQKALEMEYNDYVQMLKKLRQGADGARGDDTSKLKNLVVDWVNREFKPDPSVNPNDKNCHGFINDACAFLYDKYMADQDNLEEGLFKSTILLQAFKAIFTSPSSAKEVAGDGDGADVIENNRHAGRDVYSGKKSHTLLNCICILSNFFEKPPGRLAQQKVNRLLAWWMRKVFGTSCHAEISDGASL
ncbi:uncharacterized protein EDB93DRAFT_1106199 [Suillus bovinus]|uniref:uncharacterized protein n=1 Tax=Suillus bovinus TaxID=48563 RepID=UPI001B8639F4|nr:uncharacterized protein EDB93DRAFT_1106199 [Suillus bovinus]KAG2139091.1 hypothetical protein EDB93DRAFT_1106199 [Suillus bovinus]